MAKALDQKYAHFVQATYYKIRLTIAQTWKIIATYRVGVYYIGKMSNVRIEQNGQDSFRQSGGMFKGMKLYNIFISGRVAKITRWLMWIVLRLFYVYIYFST